MMRKVSAPPPVPQEIIKDAVKADASVQKANAENRIGRSSKASENIRSGEYGVDEDVITSKKKLLGE